MRHGHAPDVVYVVKESEENEELRHSLRSLANLPHRRVWIAGYRPSWVADSVGVIPVRQRGSKWANSTRNMTAACTHPDVSRSFVYMNDDFFIMSKVDGVPVLNRGRQADVLAATPGSRYRRGGYATAEFLRGIGIAEPILSYELHLPMTIDKSKMVEIIDIGVSARVHPFHKRTAYGAYWNIGGESVADCKIVSRDRLAPLTPFVSTGPDAFAYGKIGAAIRERFAEPGEYEKPGTAPDPKPTPNPAEPPPEPPPDTAGRGEWINYAVAVGADRAAARQMTKARLIARYRK